MSNVVELTSYTLKKEVSVTDFLLAAEKFNKEFVSLQKGYISHKLLSEGETWSDLAIWETMDDAHNIGKVIFESAVAGAYMSFIDEGSVKVTHLLVERSY